MNPAAIEFGRAIWLTFRPWRRLKIALNTRRARLGKPLLPITSEDDLMLPNGKGTYTGIAIGALGPVVAGLIVSSGIAPETCAPEAANCVPAGVLAAVLVGGAITAVGNGIAWWGRRRAESRHAAELSAAQKP